MSMTRIVLVYGTIAGAILIVSLGAAVAVGSISDSAGMAFGYLTMLIALSLVFVGVKRYRDEELGGVIRFWTALKLGFGISLLASLFYVLGWEIYMFATDYSFMQTFLDGQIEAQRAAGATPEQIEALQAEFAPMIESYANPLYRMGITFTEIAPMVLLVSLVSAALLRNPRFMPARLNAAA